MRNWPLLRTDEEIQAFGRELANQMTNNEVNPFPIKNFNKEEWNNDELNGINVDTLEKDVKKVQRPESNEELFGGPIMSMKKPFRQGNIKLL